MTADHVSPAGANPANTPAGKHLTGLGVEGFGLNTHAPRRGNHEVMMPRHRGRGRVHPLLRQRRGDHGVRRRHGLPRRGDPLVVLAGKDYGAGSSRHWAAKGPALLGVRAVLAESFERIHRSNLVGMGILPCSSSPGTPPRRWG